MQKTNIYRVDCPCACGICVPFRLHFVPVGFVPQPNQHFILPTLQAYTSAPHGLGKYSFPFRKLIHSVFSKPFSNAFPAVYIYFCDEFTPIKIKPLSGERKKYNISRQKIKRIAKIRRLTHIHAIGSKGQALRVLKKISTPRFTSGSIFLKNLDSLSSRLNWKLSFSFFSCFFSFSFLGVKIIMGWVCVFLRLVRSGAAFVQFRSFNIMWITTGGKPRITFMCSFF